MRYGPAWSASPPPSSRCHDSGAGCPASAPASAAWNACSAGANGARSACPCSTPIAISAIAANSPRALGSAESWPRKGWASMVLSSTPPSALVSRNISPTFSRYGEASGWRTWVKCAGSAASALVRSAAVCSATSGLAASTTATSRSWNCGKSRAIAMSSCRQGRLEENSVVVSVVTPSREAASQPARTASSRPPSTTATAWRLLRSTRVESRRGRFMRRETHVAAGAAFARRDSPSAARGPCASL